MRRVTQKTKVEVDERGVRLPGSHGDCVPACLASVFELPIEVFGDRDDSQRLYEFLALNYPGVSVRVRYLPFRTEEVPYNWGFWLAGIESSRFKVDCTHCKADQEASVPEHDFWRRDECRWCEGSGLKPGWHMIVMENRQRVWDPHPDADWDAPLSFVSETVFVVADPARLLARTVPA